LRPPEARLDWPEKDGLSLEVVDLRTLLPYDEEAVLASVRKCNKVILLHED
jgi:pyruvate/2-oxoglutarate/acetoin dehydrogenase E1 component